MRAEGWEERSPKAHSKNSDFGTPDDLSTLFRGGQSTVGRPRWTKMNLFRPKWTKIDHFDPFWSREC